MMDLPANATGRVLFSNTTVRVLAQDFIQTRGVLTQGGQIETAVGITTLNPKSIAMESSGGRGIRMQFVMSVNPPAGGSVTGTASVPSGAIVQFAFSGQTPQPVPNGSFSFPFPSG